MANVMRSFLEHYSTRTMRYLAEAGRPAHRVISIVPGELPAWDEACTGMLYVRVVTVAPIIPLARPASQTRGCGVTSWEVSAAVGVLRCVSTLNDTDEIPNAAQIVADGVEMTEDFTATMAAIQFSRYTTSIAGWNPLGPEGGVAGGEWLFTFTMPALILDEDEDDGN